MALIKNQTGSNHAQPIWRYKIKINNVSKKIEIINVEYNFISFTYLNSYACVFAIFYRMSG